MLQARVKAINSILDNVGKQTELCRSQLASILSTQRLRECQGFIEKVGETRFTKVKQRQLNKFNNLLNKKEGNITGISSQLNPSQSLVTSQAGRQVLTFPPGEGSSLAASQAGRCSPSLWRRKQFISFPGRQTDRHSPSPWGRKQFSSISGLSGRQVLTFSLEREAV